MFENKDNLIAMLGSPLNIASAAITELENRMGGTRIIADPNSPACHLLEFGSSITAEAINAIEEKFPLLYPSRARYMEDLYMHMSDFDYLKLYSTPSSAMLRMAFPKKYFLDYALPYNDQYKKVTIPADSIFYIGKYVFGMYYAIDILINNYTQNFTVVYDTTKDNPLHVLTKNIIDKYDFVYKGLEYLVIDFPIYQFSKSIKEESLVDATGFIKKYTYNNDFYALRIFHYKNGEYHEMGQSQSKIVYDPVRPTALVRILPDIQQIAITIPQIYFEEKLLGSKVLMEFYTTMGALDIDTSDISASNIQANFGLKSRSTTDFSIILKDLPFDTVMQLSSTKIIGGSNMISIEKLRDRVVNDLLYEKVPISEADLTAYMEDNSFSIKKALDNVTDRIYYAYKVMEDGRGSIVPSLTLKMRMKEQYADPFSSEKRNTFMLQSDGSVTMLPTAIFRYIDETDDAIPLTNEETELIAKMDKVELAYALNNNQYMKTPFHVRFDLSDKWPEAVSYNLLTPSIEKIIFEQENYNISEKMMTFSAEIIHLNNGVGGYELALAVYKSDDVKNVAENDLVVYVSVKTTDGYWIGAEATYIEERDTRSIYRINIATNYHLTSKDEIYITNFQNESFQLLEHSISLESDFHIIYLIRKSAISGNYEDSNQATILGLPTTYQDEFTAMVRQYLTIHLGHNLKDVVRNAVEVSLSSQVYEVYENDEPELYETDVYRRDSNGVLEIDEDGMLILEHEAREIKQDESGQTIYKHRAGDIVYDTDGNPKLAVDRTKTFYTDLMFIDAKVFASERQTELTFAETLPATLESYFNVIRNLQSNLLERTNVYFRCMRSTGSARFNLGDGVVVKQNLEMSFAINCYVPSFVKQSEAIQSEIKEKTCLAIAEAIKTRTISMLDIFEQVKARMSDYIDHFTLLGINGDIKNQTFTILNDDSQPSIRRILVLTDDNVLSMQTQVDMTFIALTNNTAETETYVTD